MSSTIVSGGAGESFDGEALLNECWASGETGGDLIGLSEMGDGGTNGKDSRMESARVEARDTTDEPDTLRSKPCACACACACASAYCCCSANVPAFPEDLGVTNRPIAVL